VRSEPFEDLGEMGLAYLGYAQANPLKYRLMFNSPLPDGAEHKEMLEHAQHGFSLLHDRLKTMALRDPGDAIAEPAKHDALFILSTLHGFASLMQSDVLDTIGLGEGDRQVAMGRMMRRLSLAQLAVPSQSRKSSFRHWDFATPVAACLFGQPARQPRA